jgi:arylformamidase
MALLELYAAAARDSGKRLGLVSCPRARGRLSRLFAGRAATSSAGIPADSTIGTRVAGPAGMDLYRGMNRAALAVAYNNRAVVPDWAGYLDRWKMRSDALYASRPVLRDMRYGSGARQRVDLFPSGIAGAPAMLFLHGGYWQWNDKEGQAFVAEGLLARGFDVAIGEYTLAPHATMDAICAEIPALLAFLKTELPARGLGGGGLFVSGISTGAHLSALTLGDPAVRGALLISGIYDLEPIRLSPLNDAIGMDWRQARTHSPLHAIPPGSAPAIVAYGAGERTEIRRQSNDYAAALTALERAVAVCPVAGADHFSVLETLAHADGELARAAERLARGLLP